MLTTDRLLVFTLVLTRISGLLFATPVMGAKEAPMTVRALISFALAVLIMPSQWSVVLPYPGGVLVYVVIIAAELMIGLVLGMGITIMIGGMQMAGDMMSRVGGLTLSEVLDPTTQASVPIFSQLLSLLSAAPFVIIGGHRLLMGGLLDTFQSHPARRLRGGVPWPGGVGHGRSEGLVDTLVWCWWRRAFISAFMQERRWSWPCCWPRWSLGLISRTLPQLNVMVVGFGLNAMLTFAVFSFAVGGCCCLSGPDRADARNAIQDAKDSRSYAIEVLSNLES